MKKWIIVGFKHPDIKNTLIYKQDISTQELIRQILKGIEKGCNLFSIRGFEKEDNLILITTLDN